MRRPGFLLQTLLKLVSGQHELWRDKPVGPDTRLQHAHGQEAERCPTPGSDHTVSSTRMRFATSARSPRSATSARCRACRTRHKRARQVGVRDDQRSAGAERTIGRAQNPRLPIQDSTARSTCQCRGAGRRLERARHAAQPAGLSRRRSVFVRRHFTGPADPRSARVSRSSRPSTGPRGPRDRRHYAANKRQAADAPEGLLPGLHAAGAGSRPRVSLVGAGRQPVQRETLTPLMPRIITRIDADLPGPARPDARGAVGTIDCSGCRFRRRWSGRSPRWRFMLAIVGVLQRARLRRAHSTAPSWRTPWR